ncbi:MAG: peptidylprolyl isomerase [Pseudobdellovibrionaceae bacterium]
MLSKSVCSFCFGLFFCVFSFAQKQDTVVAQVGDRKITLKEFNDKLNEVKRSAINPPTKEQFLEDLIRYEVGVLEAEKRQLQKDPIVQDRFKQELYKALLEKDLGQKVQSIQVTDPEMKEWYKKNPELRLSHILIELRFGASTEQKNEARKRANEILQEVKSSKRPFEELVRIYSDDPITKALGGDMGWITKVNVVPTVYSEAQKMRDGEIRGLIETPFGLHVIKLTGRRTFENADKRQIRLAVFEEKKVKQYNEYFDKLKKAYTIKFNPSAVQ